ncbi:DEAD/DEAH box helicase [Halocatena halophila]|uniref:DEAD/DEAH box helicase n=1 Tax=Halocatena halophila TaxID=2814576 RepID=UPI002ED2123C
MPSVPSNISKSDRDLINELLDQKPAEFTDLTVTQYEALEEGVLAEGNHILIAETGNGKTFVAETVTKNALQQGDNVAYLVPSVALVSEKHATISAWTPESITVSQGHGYTEANVIVATFESFFEAVIRGYADRFDTVILDDFHEIYSSHRGPNIEKGISAALDRNAEILAISATVGNPHTIARWLNADLTISSEKRAVPIAEHPVEKTREDYAEQIDAIIRSNREKGPFLVFNDTTSHAEARARGVAKNIAFQTEKDIDFHELVEEAISTELTDKHRELIRLLNNGIAYHHAQMEDELKDLIEAYTDKGIIKCVFCTTTLSYGFDSPVQSVIVADLKRWDGFRQFIGVYEYVQWIGRAGRDSEIYDQAYAFVLYDDEDAADTFQFDIPVEKKDLEDVTSHLSGQVALRWLVLELINHGWDNDTDVLDFVQSTLFWSENVDQAPHHVQEDIGEQPGHDIADEVRETLTWLTNHGLVTKPIGQPQEDKTRYKSTDLGSALVEYEHSNWFDDRVRNVLELTDWLKEEGSELTPERLVERLADAYYACDEGYWIEDEGPVYKKMELHNLSGKSGTTSAIICWFWCAGASITDIEDMLLADDLSGLANTTSNLSTALKSVQLLYSPFDMPDEPEWLQIFADQVDAGVPGPDMYLIKNVEHFGRVLYNNLKTHLNNLGREADWDPGGDHFMIERLSKLLADRDERLFIDLVKETDRIGTTIGENILNCVKEWDPESNEMVEVPFSDSITDRREIDQLTKYHESERKSKDGADTDEGEGTSTTNLKSTTLDDFR